MTDTTTRRFAQGLAWLCLALLPSCSLSCFGSSSPSPSGTSAGAANITVTFSNASGNDRALMLYSGREGLACDSFAAEIADPSAVVEDVTNDAGCPAEIDAFAPRLGAFGKNVDPLAPGDGDWLDQAIASGSFTTSMPPMTAVPLRLWLVADASDMAATKAVRNKLLDKAFPVLDSFGTGLSLDTVSQDLNPNQITPKCDQADAIAMNPAIYDATRINVYFVEHAGNNPYTTPAANCWLQQHPEIIFISFGYPNLTRPTLVHELGHALGLINPQSLGGHTYAIPGFDPYNLMATNTDVMEVTVGQLYALNFSSASWLNRSGSPFVREVVRTCPNSWDAGACPSLKQTQAGWPP